MQDTSWEKSSNWYKKIVGDDGHYFHQTIIFPKIKQLIDFSIINSVLDLACGQGIFERQIDQNKEYIGIDISRSLIKEASQKSLNRRHQFLVSDVSKDLPLKKNDFDLVIILNHPIFRIPRQSAWGVDSQNKIQYRRIDRYMSNLEIPISTNPGKFQKSEITWSFHNPLSKYSQLLFENGFLIEKIDEWVSEKKSTGPMAKMEDRARNEIPMFMAIVAIYQPVR